MLVSLMVVFREAMEAGLIVGIVLAATEGVPRRGGWIVGGIAAGIAGASLVAAFAAALTNVFAGAGQEVFTAAILCFAVLMLSWHIVWMSRHAAAMTAKLKDVGHAVRLGQRSLAALGAVAAVAVMREGAEVVLFLYGVVTATRTDPAAMTAGGVIGLGLAAALSWLLYRGLVIIPLRRLFSVTNMLIALLAAGMAGQASAILHSADLLPGRGEQLASPGPNSRLGPRVSILQRGDPCRAVVVTCRRGYARDRGGKPHRELAVVAPAPPIIDTARTASPPRHLIRRAADVRCCGSHASPWPEHRGMRGRIASRACCMAPASHRTLSPAGV